MTGAADGEAPVRLRVDVRYDGSDFSGWAAQPGRRTVQGTLEQTGARRGQRIATLLLFASPLLLCALGHDTSRWMGAAGIDATLFVLYLYWTEGEGSPAREYLRRWAMSPAFLAWAIYLVGIGPYGATGLRTAEQLYAGWTGP